MLRIHDIFVRIRIRGSMPPDQCWWSMTFWVGSGSGSADPCLWQLDPDSDLDPGSGFCYCQQKTNFLHNFFCLTYWRYIYIIFQRYKVKKSHKIVGIKVFLTIFAWWQKDPDPDPYLWLVDPDPGGPKTCGSGGSGFATLPLTNGSGSWYLRHWHSRLQQKN